MYSEGVYLMVGLIGIPISIHHIYILYIYICAYSFTYFFIHPFIYFLYTLYCCVAYLWKPWPIKKDKHDTLPEESGDCPVHFFEEPKGAITI